jgi:putative PIG3 family NAD(P)H quinone oxidoreductase
MRVVTHDHTRQPDLAIVDVPVPTPKPGEVLIQVAYAGVNRPDLFQRAGSYPPPADASPYMGLEVSGTITALGEGVDQWRIGDQVCALTPGGGYAEFVTAPAGHCLPVPHGLSLLQAAALPETYFTVWTNLIERGQLRPGETVLIHGGSSGIGVTAIQMAKWNGATVITTVGNEEKAAACRKLGADHVINYKTQDWQEEVKAITKGVGVNLVLDMVGGPYIDKNLRSLAIEGRLVQIAFLQGQKTEADWRLLMVKRLTFTGSTLRARPLEAKTRIAQTLHHAIWPELEAGRLLPVIHKVFPLEQVEQAHALMQSSAHVGKIMLKVANELNDPA